LLDPASQKVVAPIAGSRNMLPMRPRFSPRRLREMARSEVHPLRLYLLERGVTLPQAAAAFDMSERKLQDIISWRRPMPDHQRGALALLLGYASADAVFPYKPRPLADPPAPPGALAPEPARRKAAR
jgi:hypothetical protein